MNTQKGVAFFERDSWYHRTKELHEDGTILYGKRGGFETAEDEEQSFYACKAEFDKAYHKYILESKLNKDISLKTYLEYWFDVIFSERIVSTTRMCSGYILKQTILPNIKEDVKLRYVTTEYIDALLALSAKSSESAGNAARSLLYLAFKDAVIEEYIQENPVVDTKKYKRKKPNIRILNKSQIKILLAEASKGNWYLEILLCLFCGLRKGEVMGLKFSDFDLKERTVNIRRQVGYEFHFDDLNQIKRAVVVEKPTKTQNSNRTLRVPQEVIREVEKRKLLIDYQKQKFKDEYTDHDYICCQVNGMPRSMTSFNNAVIKLCKRNGLPRISVHSLRHMYATILLEQEVPLAKISALLGHSSVNTTFEYYCDVMDERDKIMAFMNDEFSEEGLEVG